MSVRAVNVLGVVAVGVLASWALSGCSWDGRNDFAYDLSKKVVEELKPQERDGAATVDLDDLVAGDWDELLIVCAPTTQRDLEDELGFEWPGAGMVRRSDFLGMLVFVSAKKVVGYYSVGENDAWENHFYFTPCPPSAEEIVGNFPPVVDVTRKSAQIDFRYFGGYWVVEASTLRSLAAP